VNKIADKVFVGKKVIHVDVFKRNDENTTYNVIYQDAKSKLYYVKRFSVSGVIRDKEYNLCGSNLGTVVYFSANPLGETETLTIHLKPKPRLKKLQFDFNFADIAIKGRSSKGNILSRNLIRKVVIKVEGKAVQKAAPVWYDFETRRLNNEERGQYLGEFLGSDSIIAFYESGNFCIYTFHMHIHFDDDLKLLRKYNPKDTYGTVYYHADTKSYYIKRFQAEGSPNKMIDFVDAAEGNKLFKLIEHKDAELTVVFKKEKDKKEKPDQVVVLSEFIAVKSVKAKGKRLTQNLVKDIAVHKIETFDLIEMQENEQQLPDEQQFDETETTVETPEEETPDKTVEKKDNNPSKDNDADDKSSTEQMTLFDLDL